MTNYIKLEGQDYKKYLCCIFAICSMKKCPHLWGRLDEVSGFK